MSVYPVHNNVLKINPDGRTADPNDLVTIKDITTFSFSVDGVVIEWTPMDTSGWVRRLLSGKSLTISLSGKRNYGNTGNDYLANTLLDVGSDVESEFSIDFADGSNLTLDCIVNLGAAAGGEATDGDALEVDIMSDGLPVFTEAS
jgi:hypothetical protein